MLDDAHILPVQVTEGEPTFCSQCGSVLDSTYDNVVIIFQLSRLIISVKVR